MVQFLAFDLFLYLGYVYIYSSSVTLGILAFKSVHNLHLNLNTRIKQACWLDYQVLFEKTFKLSLTALDV